MLSSAFAVILAFTLLATSTAQASCFCMLRPPPQVRTGSSITRDPAYNPATAVFLVRDGTRTIMTIEAAYQGPETELSMVIPVPDVIEREDVRTIPGSVFRNLDRRTAPKVQHVWPACARRPRRRSAAPSASGFGGAVGRSAGAEPTLEELGIEIEDEWEVDEYDVTTLDAAQSTGLLTFLRGRGLELPAAAEPALRAYIETGHRFVVLKADPSRANHVGEQMVLSPIQLDFESEQLAVPVRLGTLNSPGEQELVLYVLSADGRYELANRPSRLAPTDLELQASWSGGVAGFYGGLMDEMFRQNPGAGVTEYARDLGRGVSPWVVRQFGLDRLDGLDGEPRAAGRRRPSRPSRRYTLTRIRHRYGKDLSDDLLLRPAAPLRLTRRWRIRGANLNEWAAEGRNNFHTRFVVVHRGSSCPSRAAQRWRARRFATSDQMWGAGDDARAVWPGEALRERVDVLGIEPGSTAPPRPEVPVARVAPQAPPPSALDEAPPTGAAPIPMNIPSAPSAPPAAAASSDDGAGFFGGCRAVPAGAGDDGDGPPWAIALLALFAAFRRRRGRRSRSS